MKALKLAGIVGWPVAHSLSPVLHSYWLRKLGIDGLYVPLAARREDFGTLIEAIRKAGFSGVNVTGPHKVAAFALAHRCDAAAKDSESANLLLFDREGLIEAKNTDSFGLEASLTGALGKGALKGKTVVLVGAGGAARAAVIALEALNALEIRIANRNPARAETMARSFGPRLKARLSVHAFDDWPHIGEGAALLVNATSAGMKGQPPLKLRLDVLPKGAAVCDLVYNPIETRLLRQAKARKLKIVDGLGMLMHQAAPSFKAFYGVMPTATKAVRARLKSVLDGR
jgi:shikimate dehydrogenase